MMRILQICPGSYVRGKGGVSEHVINISERLAEKYDVTVFATNTGNKYESNEEVNGVKIERFSSFSPNGSYFFSLDMLRKLRKSDFDIIHGHAYSSFPMHFGRYAEYKKLLFTTHYHGAGHTLFRDLLLKFFNYYGIRSLEKADKIIAVSEYEKKLLLKNFKLSENKMVVIPNGVNKDEFKNITSHKGSGKKILYIGRLEKYKGILNLLEIIPDLNKEIKLEIIGNGPLKQEIINKINHYGLNDRVFLYQNLPRKELIQKYFDSDLFILLSKHEAYSLVVAEALSSGLNCILANTSALSEWIDDETCFGIDYPLNKVELMKLINYILYNKIESDMSNYKLILDWGDVVNKLIELYES
jgi:glycosyltransferase involved in cell wall biosynthesis